MEGGFGRGFDLQTEIVTDSQRTICANDTFQSVSPQYAEVFAWGLLACITPFICSNLLAFLSETAEQNYFHSVIQIAAPWCTFIQMNCTLVAAFAILIIFLFVLVSLFRLSLLVIQIDMDVRYSQHQYSDKLYIIISVVYYNQI